MNDLFVKCPDCDGDGTVIVALDCGCCQTTRDCDNCDGVGFYALDWDLTNVELREILAVVIAQSKRFADKRTEFHLREAYAYLL